ncbi:MAG: hypothetical protein R2681_04995 [Pyrinomonadaceae bacterium]
MLLKMIRSRETDSEGRFIARFDLAAEFASLQKSQWKRFEDVHYAAYLTDLTTNKTEQRRFDVRLSKEPIHIYVVRSTNNQKASDDTLFFYFLCRRTSGSLRCNIPK